MIKKTWLITGEITQQDLEWILRSKLNFVPGEQHYLDFVEIGTNIHSKIPGKLEPAEIVTTNEKEETWLKLYFDNRLRLILRTTENINLDDNF